MDEHKRNFLKQRSNSQFKRKGGSKNARGNYPSHERSFENSPSSETAYRIVFQSKKIGGVIGKGGSRIKALREETRAKITVVDSVRGSDDRVIIISSPSTKKPNTENNNSNPEMSEENVGMDPHCAAQDALLKVHDRVVEEDLQEALDEDNDEIVITTRLLVPNNLVGCLLGRKGDVIQKLRSETGASIRVLSAEHLPACAMSTDELVQISGIPALVRKALYEVSTLLHQNPRKDKPPGENMSPPRNSMWSQNRTSLNGMPPVLGAGGYGKQYSGFGRGEFDYVPPHCAGGDPSDFTMKILCSAAKIGGVIGKGGVNVKLLQQETGASIHVEDVSPESDERVIRVSSLESLLDPRSRTIDAILLLQSTTSEFSDKGIITTRLLVSSSKVGCILGQGGNVINEMRSRTRADIRVLSKDDKPKCASSNEELVQITGSLGAAKDALTEISSRLRARCLRDTKGNVESAPVRPLPGFGPSEDFRSGDPHRSSVMGAGGSRRYELLKGAVREYDHPSYPDLPISTRYSGINSPPGMKIPDHFFGSAEGTEGYNINEVAGSRERFRDPRSIGSGFVNDIRGTSDHMNVGHNVFHPSENMNAARANFQGYGSPAGLGSNIQQGTYNQGYTAQQSAYQTYPGNGGYPSGSPSHLPYQNVNPQQQQQQPPYQSINVQQLQQQHPYPNMAAQGSYHY